jgi:hypothetical protein
MTIQPVSSIQPAISRMTELNRPQEASPDAKQSAAQENEARRTAAATSGASPAYLAGQESVNASATVGTRVNVTPVPGDAEATLRNSTAQISRAYSGGEPTPANTRAASEAYRTEASARDELAQQQQGNGTRTIDVSA